MIKSIKYFIVYTLSLYLIYTLYDIQTFQAIVFEYPFIDFRYLIFMSCQFFWISFIFQFIYQYICISQFMYIRLTKKQILLFIFKRCIFYLIIYIGYHFILFTFLNIPISFNLLIKNISIQTISFLYILLTTKQWEHSYFLISSLQFILHFI